MTRSRTYGVTCVVSGDKNVASASVRSHPLSVIRTTYSFHLSHLPLVSLRPFFPHISSLSPTDHRSPLVDTSIYLRVKSVQSYPSTLYLYLNFLRPSIGSSTGPRPSRQLRFQGSTRHGPYKSSSFLQSHRLHLPCDPVSVLSSSHSSVPG